MGRAEWMPFYFGCLAGPCYQAFLWELAQEIDRDPVNATLYLAGRECPLSGRLTFRFSGGAAAPSAATGC
jgi:hypothetical protein